MDWSRDKQVKLNQARDAVRALETERARAVSDVAEFLERLGVQRPNISAPVSLNALPGVPLAHPSVYSNAAEILALHADSIRDLLAPFDSGVREG